MSAIYASALPSRPLRERQHPHPRHIEVVATRSQRRARPRVRYAIVGVAGILSIFLAQLLLSIALSDGAYRISDLTQTEKGLERSAQAFTEQREVYASPQNLATLAHGLGMVSSGAPVFLRLDGKVSGTPTAAKGSSSAPTLVPNSLLGHEEQGKTSKPVKSVDPAPTPSDPDALPSPVTH